MTTARIGVIGGGRMGAGIAHVFAAAGCEVTVVDASPEARRTARDRIEKTLAQAAARSKLSDPVDQVLERIRLPGDAALVIEAVPELPGVKADVLAAAERAVGPRCVIAFNTSLLSITAISRPSGSSACTSSTRSRRPPWWRS